MPMTAGMSGFLLADASVSLCLEFTVRSPVIVNSIEGGDRLVAYQIRGSKRVLRSRYSAKSGYLAAMASSFLAMRLR